MLHDTIAPEVSPLQRGCLVLAAALLVSAAAGELVALNSTPVRGPIAAGRTTAVVHADRLTADRALPPRTRAGRVLVRLADAGFSTLERDGSDTSLLHVLVPHGSAVIDCNLIAAQVTVLRQDSRQVRLLVSGYEYVPAADARHGSGGTTCVTAGTASLPVRLRAPLGDRAVFSGQARQAVRVDPHRASVP